MSKVEYADPSDLIEIGFESQKEQLPTYFFEEVEEELTKFLVLESEDEEETDGAFDLIRNIVDKIRHDIEQAGLSGDLQKFLYTLYTLYTLTKILRSYST